VPAAVVLLLPGTVWRATRSRGTRDSSAPS